MTERIPIAFTGARGGECALSWGQFSIWRAIQRLGPDGASLNMSWVTALEDEGISVGTPLSRIQDTVVYSMSRHESLRTRVRVDGDGGDARQVVAAQGIIDLLVVDAEPDGAAAAAGRLQRELTEPQFDYAEEWPLRVGAVRVGDVVTHAVFAICHMVTDRGGLTALVRDVLSALGGHPDLDPPDLQPFDLARHQQSDAGRRQSDKALRYWQRHLRAVPRDRFGPPDGEPRFISATLSSPAGDQAVSLLAERERTSTSAVILAAAAVQLARQTGHREAVLQVIVSNRFRPGLAGSVGPASQDGLCVVEVGDDGLVPVIGRAMQASMQAYLHAQYDPVALDALVAGLGDVDLSCSFNDRRFDAQTPVAAAAGVSADGLRAALERTTLSWAPVEQYGARYFLHVNPVPGVLDLTLFADTSVLPRAAVEEHLRGIETLLVTEALAVTA